MTELDTIPIESGLEQLTAQSVELLSGQQDLVANAANLCAHLHTVPGLGPVSTYRLSLRCRPSQRQPIGGVNVSTTDHSTDFFTFEYFRVVPDSRNDRCCGRLNQHFQFLPEQDH